MNKTKTIWVWVVVVLSLCAQMPRGDEGNGPWGLSSTFLSGFFNPPPIATSGQTTDDTTSGFGSIVVVAIPNPAQLFTGSGVLVNDSFANALPIAIGQTVLPTNLTNATLEEGEPVAAQQMGSVWYRWTAPEKGVARISKSALPQMATPAATSLIPALSDESIFYPDGGITWESGTDGLELWNLNNNVNISLVEIQRWWASLSVYRTVGFPVQPTSLELVQRGDNLEVDVEAGESFWIALEIYESGPMSEAEVNPMSGPLVVDTSLIPDAIYLDLVRPPANDSFASGLAVADSSYGTMVGYTLSATREAGEPNLGNEFSGGSVWFHYTAATYGTVSFSPSSGSITLAVFTGADVSKLQLVAKTSSENLSFFGEEGTRYHIAVYQDANNGNGFTLNYSGPRYRLYETNVDGLMPNGLAPHFYGVRGSTMLLYAKSAAGWNCVEIEPIVNRTADLLIDPANVVDGQLRVITVDEALPSPHVKLRSVSGQIVADLVGFPGQTCAVSFSADLVNWSAPQVYTLDSETRTLEPIVGIAADGNIFYRVIQSLPQSDAPPGVTGVSGVVQVNPNHGSTGILAPPVPGL